MQRLLDQVKIVEGVKPQTISSSVDGDYVSLKGYDQFTAVLNIDVTSSGAGATVTLKQATAVAGTSEKALSFSTMYKNVAVASGDTLSSSTVSSTFTTLLTASQQMYVITVNAGDLDTANNFDCVRIDLTAAASNNAAVNYLLSKPRYSVGEGSMPAAITD